MEIKQLIGRYLRLRGELASVFKVRPFHADRAKRLAGDLRTTRAAMVEVNHGTNRAVTR